MAMPWVKKWLFYLIDLVANCSYMIKTIKKRVAIYSHPCKGMKNQSLLEGFSGSFPRVLEPIPHHTRTYNIHSILFRELGIFYVTSLLIAHNAC